MRKPIMGGNWKMYKTRSEAVETAKALKDSVKDVTDREIVLFVSPTLIPEVAKALEGSNVGVGAQNMYFEKEGAFTGEVSPSQVLDAGAKYVLIGHSERRHIFGESDELINKKVKAALANGIVPVLCVGELLEEREANKVKSVLTIQTTEGFKGLSRDQALKTVIAYEPVWAIGTGKTATPEDADEAHDLIRGVLKSLYDTDLANNIRIMYGGSVKPDNIDGLMAKTNIDGGLVGGASLKADSFTRIVKFQ